MGLHGPESLATAFRWADNWHATFQTSSDWCQRHLKPALRDLTDALKKPPGLDWRESLVVAARRHPGLQSAFRDAFAERDWNHALPEHVVYPTSNWPLFLRLYRSRPASGFEIEFQNGQELAALRKAISGEWKKESRTSAAAVIAQQLVGAGAITDLFPERRHFEGPGVYRLQHAGALVVSRRAKILVDPVSQVHPNWEVRPECLVDIDAVLISHSHNDHFSLTTLLTFPRDMLFILPRVKRASMLCPDMAGLLRAAGFTRVREADWWEDILVKDQIVHVLPFHGEQPWLHAPPPTRDLRNIGNTYLIDFGAGNAWFLIDSGQEYDASMLEVAAKVRKRIGPVDLVLSNLRDFPWCPEQINGSGMYLFCLETETLSDPARWPKGVMTLGANGVAAFLAAAEARFFLPYAHWWAEPGKPIEGREAEAPMMHRLEQACTRLGVRTRLVEWNVLDGFLHRRDGWVRLTVQEQALAQAAE